MQRLFGVISLAALATAASQCKREPSATDRTSHPATSSASAANGVEAGATASAGAPRTKVTAEAGAMGTRLNFVALTSDRIDEPHVHAAIEQAIEEIRRLESLMTTWKDDSEVSRINQSAGKAPVQVGPETLDVVAKSLWISERSG